MSPEQSPHERTWHPAEKSWGFLSPVLVLIPSVDRTQQELVADGLIERHLSTKVPINLGQGKAEFLLSWYFGVDFPLSFVLICCTMVGKRGRRWIKFPASSIQLGAGFTEFPLPVWSFGATFVFRPHWSHWFMIRFPGLQMAQGIGTSPPRDTSIEILSTYI